MGIVKYEPPEPVSTFGECEAAPKGWLFPVYTDIEGLRRYPDVLVEGEEVVISEKLHGCNSRFLYDGQRLWVGSHTQIKKFSVDNLWWKVAEEYKLEEKLSAYPMCVFFGECFGQVQDLKYDVKSGSKLRVFDIYDIQHQRYFDYDDAFNMVEGIGLTYVPILYRGPWKKELNELCEGQSTLASNVREGFVVKPVKERWDERVGRVALKRHGEGYLLRKKGK
jgi:RNA ligase (TIGR02306 family)